MSYLGGKSDLLGACYGATVLELRSCGVFKKLLNCRHKLVAFSTLICFIVMTRPHTVAAAAIGWRTGGGRVANRKPADFWPRLYFSTVLLPPASPWSPARARARARAGNHITIAVTIKIIIIIVARANWLLIIIFYCYCITC